MKEEFGKRELASRSENFSDWYSDVILKAELADYGPVKGTMVIRPYGYALWERVQQIFDGMIKEDGVQNAYFPMFIPEHLLKREKEHVEGFAPEVAVVTHAGGKKLSEPLVIRPTSETIIYEMFAKWIHSWRDLPLRINQWVNVVRWELRTYLFLRTSEFLWQEGHTVHEDHESAKSQVMRALDRYVALYQEYFALAGIAGKKSPAERFAGAESTYTYEMLMPDGKALQGCTSHDLGQNFSKAFHIEFQGRDAKTHTAWQTSWGLSTRSIGGLVMAHGDGQGLVLPPRLASIQLVIIPIYRGKEMPEEIARTVSFIRETLNGNVRLYVDERTEYTPGWKFNEWELKGVPLRLELGAKECLAKQATLARRDTGEKVFVELAEIGNAVPDLLDSIQRNLFDKSSVFTQTHTHEATDLSSFKNIMNAERGFIRAFWCEDPACEARIKEETKATTRCLPLDAPEEKGKCVYCTKPASHRWIFAQAY